MDSDLHRHHHLVHDRQNPHQQQLEQQMNSGLMRYKSAPSSYFASLIDGGVGGGGEICGEFLNPRPSTPETDRIFARFMSSGGTETSSSHNLCDIGQNSSANEALESQFVASMKHETDIFHHQRQHDQQQQNNGYSSAAQAIYQNQSQPSLPNHTSAASNSGIDNSYRVVGSIAVDRLPQMKMGGGGCGNSNLIRHSSSPAGFFSHINVENGRMTPISEDGSKSMGMSDPEDESFSEDHGNDRAYITGFPIGSWDDSAILSDSFPKRLEDDRKTFSSVNALDSRNAEGGNRPPTVLSHHLSLPKSSAELAAMEKEKLFQFQDSVPCKIRAKRGCATHPRSIAERVRRTRISERMRKLQGLVPNMDKQTNTSDMLDLAVDYIKDLQKHVKILSDNRSKCTCSNKQKP